MTIASVCFLAFWMSVAFSAAKAEDCPAVPCPKILYQPICRSVSFFLHGTNQVCQGCDKCVVASDNLDENGCPLQACTLKLIPEKCNREVYYIYQGRKVCKDCPQDTCRKYS